MSDLDALLAEIIARPDEDTLRLAYADCLEERGEPGDGLHARFVRDQVAGVPRMVPLSMLVPLEPLTGIMPHQTTRHATAGGSVVACSRATLVFRRGFADEVTCEAADWIRHGREVRRRHPVTCVNLTTLPDYDMGLFPTPDGLGFVSTVPGIAARVTRDTPPTPGELLDMVRDALAAEYPGVGFTLPGPTRPVAAALELITGRPANAVVVPSWEGLPVSDVRLLPRTGWVVERVSRPVEAPPATGDQTARPAVVVERTVREWRFTVEVPAAIPVANLGVPFGPVEGVDRDGRAWVADRVVLTDAAELPGGGARYAATACGPPRRA